LNHACEESSDLLVMGAFRSDKPVLGKIARHVLQHMTLPVLMSH
jgi:nucleotide-binding universal stress UspA family protein